VQQKIFFSELTRHLPGSFGCGNDFVEARITMQRIPARIEAEIAVGRASWDLRDNFESLEREARA